MTLQTFPNYSGDERLAQQLAKRIEKYWSLRGHDWVRCTVHQFKASSDTEMAEKTRYTYHIRSNMNPVPVESAVGITRKIA